MIHRPALSADPDLNRRRLQEALDSSAPGRLEIPSGLHFVADGLRVPAGWEVRGHSVTAAGGGTPESWLESLGTTGRPVLHITGSNVSISDLGLRPAPHDPGKHGGDRGTAITVGDYLYPQTPSWISRVDVRRVQVARPGDRASNSIAVMGAVRGTTLHDIMVRGGYTGLAVHWGAAGADVTTIVGPTYHPHRLTVTDLRVRDAIEGFYLSSVHDVSVSGACLRDVDFGFRLLPGDNTDRWAPSAYDEHAPQIGSNIEIADVCVQWHGADHGALVAGWGRSEVDGVISRLRYANTVVRDCRLYGAGGESWTPLRMDRAAGVELREITVASAAPIDEDCCPLAAGHAAQ